MQQLTLMLINTNKVSTIYLFYYYQHASTRPKMAIVLSNWLLIAPDSCILHVDYTYSYDWL